MVSELARIMKPGGQLLFLVPTENWFYNVGRMLFRYQKPEDHYYSAKEIEEVIEKYFKPDLKRNLPFNLPGFISIYRVGRFNKIDK